MRHQQPRRNERGAKERICVPPVSCTLAVALHPERRDRRVGECVPNDEAIVSVWCRSTVVIILLVTVVIFHRVVAIQEPVLIRVPLIAEHHHVLIRPAVPVPPVVDVLLGIIWHIKLRLLGWEDVVELVVEIVVAGRVILVVVVFIVVINITVVAVVVHHVLVALSVH